MRAARAARLLVLARVVLFFFFVVFCAFFALAAETDPDVPVVAPQDWVWAKANAISAESITTSHRELRRDADEGENKSISSLYSAFAFNARRLEPALSIRPECLARAFFWRLPALHV